MRLQKSVFLPAVRLSAFLSCPFYCVPSLKKLAVCVFLVVLFPALAHAVVPTQERPIVVLRALDKMTARVEEIDLPVGKTIQFGTLSIVARTCRVTLPEEAPPESAAYLEISEIAPGEQDKPVFKGWMFASSPALSAMEHPVYDIWITGCKDETQPPGSSEKH
ncbi:MAG: DUF2155 domain-containing protein [Alphaproteobacteria bacterium]|nr:DUF2155 domain-containing protein [Alphaproteobacteria bacterium]